MHTYLCTCVYLYICTCMCKRTNLPYSQISSAFMWVCLAGIASIMKKGPNQIIPQLLYIILSSLLPTTLFLSDIDHSFCEHLTKMIAIPRRRFSDDIGQPSLWKSLSWKTLGPARYPGDIGLFCQDRSTPHCKSYSQQAQEMNRIQRFRMDSGHRKIREPISCDSAILAAGGYGMLRCFSDFF